jgi:hypothetical protein
MTVFIINFLLFWFFGIVFCIGTTTLYFYFQFFRILFPSHCYYSYNRSILFSHFSQLMLICDIPVPYFHVTVVVKINFENLSIFSGIQLQTTNTSFPNLQVSIFKTFAFHFTLGIILFSVVRCSIFSYFLNPFQNFLLRYGFFCTFLPKLLICCQQVGTLLLTVIFSY